MGSIALHYYLEPAEFEEKFIEKNEILNPTVVRYLSLNEMKEETKKRVLRIAWESSEYTKIKKDNGILRVYLSEHFVATSKENIENILKKYELFLNEQKQASFHLTYELTDQFVQEMLRKEGKAYAKVQSISAPIKKIFDFMDEKDTENYKVIEKRLVLTNGMISMNASRDKIKSDRILNSDDLKVFLSKIIEEEIQHKIQKNASQEEKKKWIEENGSLYLKKTFRAGYDSQRQYVKERAKMEFPQYELDFDNQAKWKDRTSPSRQALEEEEKIKNELLVKKMLECKVKTVWLVTHQPSEAVVIDDYLGRYTLLKKFQES